MKSVPSRSLVLATAAVTLTLLLAPLPPAYAAGIVVSNTADTTANGDGCTLREAIFNANANARTWPDCAAGNGADTITFDVSGTIRLGSALPNIADAAGLTIDGAGQSVTISGDTDGNGTADVPIFTVNASALLVAQNVTIANGNASLGGGGITNNNGTVTVLNSVLSGNHGSFGGAIYQGDGHLTITTSAFVGNSAGDDGGAIFNNGGTLTVTNSTFSGNSTGGTGWAGALFNNGGPLVVTGSTFSNNSSTAHGGGVAVNAGTAIVTNSTFAGNTAASGGGGIMTNAPLTLTNTTFSANSASFGSSVFNSSGTALLRNTILSIGSSGWNCSGWIQNGGNNIDSGQSCGMNSNGSVSNTNPMLGSLANNGGPTQTMGLQSGSPAIDAGNAAVCALAPPAGPGGRDQRGVAHKGVCDIGAFELNNDLMLPLLSR